MSETKVPPKMMAPNLMAEFHAKAQALAGEYQHHIGAEGVSTVLCTMLCFAHRDMGKKKFIRQVEKIWWRVKRTIEGQPLAPDEQGETSAETEGKEDAGALP